MTTATRTLAPGFHKATKPRMLVVDDEPDNLDLLYRTFRKEYQVLKAASGKAALEVLTREGEVAVIISDQRMPEMKGTEFLSRTVPQFPDTVRIILTGFTDVEDLVEAINSGQVYRYITKPWDPEELKEVVYRATETYELLKQCTDELCLASVQAALVSRITELAQTCDQVETALSEIAAALTEAFKADGCWFQRVSEGQLVGIRGKSGLAQPGADEGSDAIAAQAIATQTPQILPAPTADALSLEGSLYASLGVETLVMAPVLYRHQVIALFALQWQQKGRFSEAYQELLRLSLGPLALALVCLEQG